MSQATTSQARSAAHRPDSASDARTYCAPPAGNILWSPTGDIIIDSIQEKLNGLSADPTDAQTTSALRGLFNELPEDALYSFCRTEQILMHYQLRFSDPELRTAASTASQNLIYLQNIFTELYGPAFYAQEQCNRFGSCPPSECQSNLANRLNPWMRSTAHAPRRC